MPLYEYVCEECQHPFEALVFGDAQPEFAAATRIWRRMFESEEQLARDGAAFVRAGLVLR